ISDSLSHQANNLFGYCGYHNSRVSDSKTNGSCDKTVRHCRYRVSLLCLHGNTTASELGTCQVTIENPKATLPRFPTCSDNLSASVSGRLCVLPVLSVLCVEESGRLEEDSFIQECLVLEDPIPV